MSNKKKSELLGVAHGTAQHRLRKSIMFMLVVETNKNICSHCKKIIDNIDHFSIEHISPWMSAEDPKESFYSLNNIAFSHLSCNSSAASKPYQKYFTKEERLEADRKKDRKRYGKMTIEQRRKRRRDIYERYGV